MYKIIKRDGKIVDFDITKIANAIKKAFEATDTEYTDDIIDFIALKVSADFLPKIKDGYVAVEDIQDSVEAVLSRGGYEGVAKAYILYRKQREKLRNMKNTYLDYKETVNSYVNVLDWRVKENSTVTYSVGGLILSNSGAITANYWLSEIYDEEIGNAHRNCDLHLHDLSMLTGYCAGWSLKQLLNEQINKEFYSAYLYLDFANYYASVGLDGFENWYRVQAQEERDHAMLFYQYLQNNGEGVTFEAIAKPEWERGDHMTPLKKALEHEKLVTASIDAIYAAAYEVRDFRAMQMLDWFIKEQGEEEKNAADLITKMELFGGDSKGLYMLNSELKARVYTAPSLVL